MTTALVPIADGTEELEAVTIIDVLRRAGVTVTVASVKGPRVTCSHGVALDTDCLISDCAGKVYDSIALPGGMPGAEHLRDCPVLTALLKEQAAAGRIVAAICASPVVVLHHHGLLNERKATAYPGMAADLAHADASGAPVIVDGHFITSKGPGTAIAFALALARALRGAAVEKEVAAAMLVG
jgi:4-methyl-5(b-hydroxyethyl)-thiazole monophosphate biosynthesis